MKKKLSRYGNSLALIIDKPILELLQIKEDTILFLKTDGKQLIISPESMISKNEKKKKLQLLAAETIHDEKLRKIVEEVMEEFSEDLEILANN